MSELLSPLTSSGTVGLDLGRARGFVSVVPVAWVGSGVTRLDCADRGWPCGPVGVSDSVSALWPWRDVKSVMNRPSARSTYSCSGRTVDVQLYTVQPTRSYR